MTFTCTKCAVVPYAGSTSSLAESLRVDCSVPQRTQLACITSHSTTGLGESGWEMRCYLRPGHASRKCPCPLGAQAPSHVGCCPAGCMRPQAGCSLPPPQCLMQSECPAVSWLQGSSVCPTEAEWGMLSLFQACLLLTCHLSLHKPLPAHPASSCVK